MLKTKAKRHLEVEELRGRLAELEDTLNAIRTGEVDALIVNGPNGDQVYSLKGAEQPYRVFVEQMTEGAVTLDNAGTILYANLRFSEMLGEPLERVIGASLKTFITDDHQNELKSLLASPKAAKASIHLRTTNGKPRPASFALSGPDEEMLGGGNTPTRALVITDLTDRHEREALTTSLTNLQSAQRELEKQYQEVQAVRTQLEAANAAKDEFLAALSHELRTPLTPVLLTANAMAVDPSLPNELREDLEMIRRNVELEARLIDDLLDMTRITRGKLQLAPQPTDLHEMLTLALNICQSETAAKRLRFVIRLDATYHYVHAEAVRLQQIFWNLIRNAVKFTPPGGSITISTKNLRKTPKDDSPAIVVSVQDSGIGIEPKLIDRVFNAFEQGSGEITKRFGGLGIGLTISKRLVELHQGSINATSKGKNKGTTFTVTLPTIVTPVLSKASAAANNGTGIGRSVRILLVEDHDDTRRNMTRLLTALHHTVVPASDSASALAAAKEDTFDLVISDIGLPDGSGLDLMRALKAKHKLRGICLSGYGMEEDIAKSLAAGFSEHLTKPINFQRLELAINAAVNKPE
jgi:PAS domain S-box-containing protein